MSKKVLVVDDAAFMRKLLKNIIKEQGFDVIGEGSNGLEAVELIESLNPEILFIDITMPMLDGVSAIEKIREKNKQVKIIVCSAMASQEMVIKSIKVGADDFVQKPFTEEKIIEALAKIKS